MVNCPSAAALVRFKLRCSHVYDEKLAASNVTETGRTSILAQWRGSAEHIRHVFIVRPGRLAYQFALVIANFRSNSSASSRNAIIATTKCSFSSAVVVKVSC